MIHPVIHPTVQIFGEKLKVGQNVRIDAFCVISGDVEIGDNVHISCGVYLYGSSGKITIGNYAGISAGCCVFTATDDFVEGYLTGPCVPDEYRKVHIGDVTIEEAVVIGAKSIVFPGVKLGRGCAVGALSLVKKSVTPYSIVVGPEQRIIGTRNDERMESFLQAVKEKK